MSIEAIKALRTAQNNLAPSRGAAITYGDGELWDEYEQAIKSLEQSTEQEPVAWRVRWPKMGGGYAWVMNDAPLMKEHGFVNEPLYTSQPQRQPMTDDEIISIALKYCEFSGEGSYHLGKYGKHAIIQVVRDAFEEYRKITEDKK